MKLLYTIHMHTHTYIHGFNFESLISVGTFIHTYMGLFNFESLISMGLHVNQK